MPYVYKESNSFKIKSKLVVSDQLPKYGCDPIEMVTQSRSHFVSVEFVQI